MLPHNTIRNAAEASKLLGALGNEKRLAIMCLLMAGEMSVGAIAERVRLSQSALSQHLAKLRALDLVATRRDRQTIYYSCNSPALEDLLATLERIYGTKRGTHPDQALHVETSA